VEFPEVGIVHKSSYKVPGGKLIKVSLEVEDRQISRILITGDFFIHPESTLPEIEENLIGCTLDKDEITEVIQSSLDARKAYPVGFTASDMAHAILKAFD
jgi:lipoate-protein ligase A